MTTYTIFRTGSIEGNPSFSNKNCAVETNELKTQVSAMFLAVEVVREGAVETHADRSSAIELIDGDRIRLVGTTYLRFNSSMTEVIAEGVDESTMQDYLVRSPVVIRITPHDNTHTSDCCCCEDETG
tara:strand:+ start:151 stop:531 length:381 start_codon:yes stop_codon:yes gene_type:complete